MTMQIAEHNSGKFITLAPEGDLDANSSMLMDEKIQDGIDRDVYRFHIDCTGLRYISSAGLGVFISFMEVLSVHEGKFVFSSMSENVHSVFRLLGLEQLMEIVSSKEEAEKMLSV
jgi:anti-sigma B factor antagonist